MGRTRSGVQYVEPRRAEVDDDGSIFSRGILSPPLVLDGHTASVRSTSPLPPSWAGAWGGDASPRPMLELVAEALSTCDDDPMFNGAAKAASFLAKLRCVLSASDPARVAVCAARRLTLRAWPSDAAHVTF
jgi:hypothetical protein